MVMYFSIEYINTLSRQNLSNFEEGQRGRLLKLISLYVTILFVEKKILMKMKPDAMEV